MRVTIAHTKNPEDVKKIVDHSIEDVFKGAGVSMLQITDARKSWNGNTLSFSLTARAGFLHAPIKGTVLVADKEITIDADLGIFGKFISQEQAKSVVESKAKGLLT